MTEIETTLRLTAPDRRKTLHELKGLDRLGPYRFLHPRLETVRDRYLDTPGKRFRKSRFAVRLRESDRETLVTLKGPATRNADGSRRRLEIELPWTAESTARIFRELAARGMDLPGDWNSAETCSREELITGAGLQPFQERILIREIRDLFLEKAGPDRFAEMVIDQVAYKPGGHECRHAEMELELKLGTDPALLEPVADLFRGVFGDRLELWLSGKLAIGIALEKLFKDGPQAGLRDDNHWLTEEAYRRIREILGR